MIQPQSTQSLWDFALAFYTQPQVAETCLQLQDDYQANVCLLIGLQWLDRREQVLNEVEFNALHNHVQNWTLAVVEPLRRLRRQLKLPFADWDQDETQSELRATIKHAELMAEKKLLIEIEHWATTNILEKKSGNCTNVENYLVSLSAPQRALDIIQQSIDASNCD